MNVAHIFPGQGSQFVGMARTLFESNRSAQLLLEQAESLCKVPLKTIMMDGPLDDLTKPSIAQPAILTTSLAYYYSSNESNRRHDCCKVMLGHSLGEYTALCSAGALEFSQAVLLVRKRGLAMEECLKSSTLAETGFAMAAIILTPKGKTYFSNRTEELVAFINDPKQSWNNGKDWVNVANINSSSQIVLSGSKNGVDLAGGLLQTKQLAARAIYLPVGAPFHSKFMKSASQALIEYVKELSFNPLKIPVISNVTSKPFSNQKIGDLLLEGIYSPVLWHPSILYVMEELKVKHFVEYGPRPVLGNLLKRDFGNQVEIDFNK